MGKRSAIVALFALSACSAPLEHLQGEENGSVDVGEAGEGEGAGDRGESDPATLVGRYSLESTLDLTLGALAPEPAYGLLQELQDDPGQLLVALADAAGAPAAQSLFDALPSSLEERVAGWITDALIASGPVELQALIAWSQVILTRVELRSTLTVPALDAAGHSVGTHELLELAFDLGDDQQSVSIPQLDALPGSGSSTVELWLESDGQLVFGEQRYGLLIGEAAYRAFDAAIDKRYGTDLRGLFGQVVACADMAEEVANQCVLGVCVGHEAELLALCEAGLDEVDKQIHDQFLAFDMELLLLHSGEATLSGAANQSRLEEGQWQAEAELGQGLRSMPATFVGQVR